jgi:hypothetical protein
MPRRLIVKKNEIYVERAAVWEYRYRCRQTAKAMIDNGWGATRIIEVLERAPVPHLAIDASLLDAPPADRVSPMELMRDLAWPVDYRELLCVWYWSEAHWMLFVHEFQSLPEPVGDYYYLYDGEMDTFHLVPMASKAKKPSTSQVQPKYNPSTTMALVPGNG